MSTQRMPKGRRLYNSDGLIMRPEYDNSVQDEITELVQRGHGTHEVSIGYYPKGAHLTLYTVNRSGFWGFHIESDQPMQFTSVKTDIMHSHPGQMDCKGNKYVHHTYGVGKLVALPVCENYRLVNVSSSNGSDLYLESISTGQRSYAGTLNNNIRDIDASLGTKSICWRSSFTESYYTFDYNYDAGGGEHSDIYYTYIFDADTGYFSGDYKEHKYKFDSKGNRTSESEDVKTFTSIRNQRIYLGAVTNSGVKHLFTEYDGLFPNFSHPASLATKIKDKVLIPDINNIENLSQLKDLSKSLPPIKELCTKHNLKSLADLYLWYKYSYLTTSSDMSEYLEFLFKYLGQSSIKGVDNHISVTYRDRLAIRRYNVWIQPYDSSLCERLGLVPNMSNLWDCVPCSFIFDWLANIGDILAQLDADDFVTQLKVRTVLYSYKGHKMSSIKEAGLFGAVEWTLYHREYMSSVPMGVDDLSLQDPSKYWLNASSLYVANRH